MDGDVVEVNKLTWEAAGKFPREDIPIEEPITAQDLVRASSQLLHAL